MEHNPAEHDEVVSQFCAMTGTQPAEVSFVLLSLIDVPLTFSYFFCRRESTSQQTDGIWKLR